MILAMRIVKLYLFVTVQYLMVILFMRIFLTLSVEIK